eukprot:GSMAST32.ASY1.ANO1.1040.1 assembled CDS
MSLVKNIYQRIFTWLVEEVNNNNSSNFIGILDIFGFEIMQINSLEQLCINFANEKLQNLFNNHMYVFLKTFHISQFFFFFFFFF